jgi:hypothetical protein
MLRVPNLNAGHELHFQIYKLPPCTVMHGKQINGPNTSVSDLSYSRPVVIDLGAFGFQDKSMTGLRQAYVLGCLLCYGAQS